jgi:hypothetical protein
MESAKVPDDQRQVEIFSSRSRLVLDSVVLRRHAPRPGDFLPGAHHRQGRHTGEQPDFSGTLGNLLAISIPIPEV